MMNTPSRIMFAIFTFGFVFNFLETWYFGWNWKASCPAESFCNSVSSVLIIIGLAGQMYYKGA